MLIVIFLKLDILKLHNRCLFFCCTLKKECLWLCMSGQVFFFFAMLGFDLRCFFYTIAAVLYPQCVCDWVTFENVWHLSLITDETGKCQRKPKIGAFFFVTEPETYNFTRRPEIRLLLIVQHEITLSRLMSHYLNVVVTYKEEAGILCSAVWATCRQRENPTWHMAICCLFINKEMGL